MQCTRLYVAVCDNGCWSCFTLPVQSHQIPTLPTTCLFTVLVLTHCLPGTFSFLSTADNNLLKKFSPYCFFFLVLSWFHIPCFLLHRALQWLYQSPIAPIHSIRISAIIAPVFLPACMKNKSTFRLSFIRSTHSVVICPLYPWYFMPLGSLYCNCDRKYCL